MRTTKCFGQSIFLLLIATLCFSFANGRELIEINSDWSFTLGEHKGAQNAAFDDSQWSTVQLPHDWAFEASYDPNAAQMDKGGYKPGGIGWYRRSFDAPTNWLDQDVVLQFDGVYMDSQVWLNGELVGGRKYGYLSFDANLGNALRPGKNVIAVRVDNSLEPSARWYHGCGIYAPVAIRVTSPTHIEKDGVFIQTPVVSSEAAQVSIHTSISSNSTQTPVKLRTLILDSDGKLVTKQETVLTQDSTTQEFSVAHPKLWDIETPHLYIAESHVLIGDHIVDTVRTRFGIREIRWEIETGFWINGRNQKVLGVADHLEAGPMGAAQPEKIIRWKIQLLKEMGVNAIRVAHNPQTPTFYDICDELGMLVMDEIFDGWRKKAPQDYGARFFDEHWETDLRYFIRRNRNHPSIIIYSLGNETSSPIASELVRVSHEMNPSRLFTSGHSNSKLMDVYGVNGGSEKQSFYKNERPAKPFISTEAPHTWQVRGYYRTKTWWRDGYPNKGQDPFPIPDLTEEEIFRYDWAPASKKSNRKQVFNSSYDNATVRISARKNWELMRDLPWFSGHFRWTGFDYLGEAGYVHGGWPFRAFMGGALDLAGFKKDLFYFYQSQWSQKPMVHLLPHWTHPTMEIGTEIPIWAYSNAEEVELFLNGRSLGRDRPGTKAEEMQCEWYVPWEPGILEAVAYRNGKEVARTRQATAERPTQISISSDTTDLATSLDDVAVVTIEQQDASGNFYPYGENRIAFHLEGPARILSLENGNPIDTEPNFGQTTRRAFFGLTRAFIQPDSRPGSIFLTTGAISGERRQLTSNLVSIDTQQISLRGKRSPTKFKIRYTTDGSKPTAKSLLYRSPFPVELDTTVRATVYRSGKELFSLQESFASDVGIHWLAPGESSELDVNGMQAEDAIISPNASIKHSVSGHYGTGYTSLLKGGFVKFYQENDGEERESSMTFRYQSTEAVTLLLKINESRPQEVKFPASNNQWGETTIKGRIERGGNDISITNLNTNEVLIDEIEVSSNS